MIIEVENKDPLIDVKVDKVSVEVSAALIKTVEIEKEIAVIEVAEKEIEVIEVQTLGPQGPPGQPGPPGGFEIVPITITAIDVWYPVPLAIITQVVDVVVYDQLNRQKVEIDVRINVDQSVDVKSKLLKTYNIHVSGI